MFVVDPVSEAVFVPPAEKLVVGGGAIGNAGPDVVGNHHFLEIGQISQVGRDHRIQLRVDDQHRGPGMSEDVGDLRSCQTGVDRYEHGPDQRHRRVGDQHLRQVRHQIGDAVTGRDSRSEQSLSDHCGRRFELAIGEPAIAVDDRDLVGEDIGRSFQQQQRG